MTKYRVTVLRALCIVSIVIGLAACRGGGLAVEAFESGNELDPLSSESSGSRVILAVTSNVGGENVGVVSVNKDAAITSNGRGTNNGSTGVTSITDTAAASCAFTFDPTSVNGNVDVVSDANNCTSLNSCIVCSATALNNDCTLSCAGDVPSNATIAADSVKIQWTMTTDFTSDMPAADGAIRIDGSVTDWDDFVPNGGAVTVDYDVTGCDGAGGVMDVDATDPLSIGLEAGGDFKESFDIAVVGDGNCQLVTSIEAEVSLAGVEVGGTTVDLSGDSTSAEISATSKICDLGANTTQCPE